MTGPSEHVGEVRAIPIRAKWPVDHRNDQDQEDTIATLPGLVPGSPSSGVAIGYFPPSAIQ